MDEPPPAEVRLDVGDAPAGQAALDSFMASLEGEDGPTYYSYPALVRYAATAPGPAGGVAGYGPALGGALADTVGAVAARLLALAGGEVFLADGCAFGREALPAEFPELAVFRIRLDEAFAASPAVPGLWLETQRFADLRFLSRMRREVRRTGLSAGRRDVLELVALLLGLDCAGAPASALESSGAPD